jgi:predicted  nucleic acid-binding Zn-ribbon protein
MIEFCLKELGVVEQNDMFQLILQEVKDSNKAVMDDLKQVKNEINQVKDELHQVKDKVDRIEKVVLSHTEILNSFKFDVDYIAQRQTKTDMKVNRIVENLLNS